MKKITFLADATNAHMERWVFALQDAYAIQIITPVRNENFDTNIQQVVYNQNPGKIFPFRQLGIIWEIYRTKKSIRTFAPDILHVHYALAHPIMYALPKDVPLVTSLWGSDIIPLPGRSYSDKFMKYLRMYMEQSKVVTVTSKYLNGVFGKLFPDITIAPDIIPFGIDTSLFSPKLRENPKPVVVGFARAFLRHYGFLDLLRACEPLLKQGLITLKVAGSGQEENYYKYEVTRMQLQRYVEFVGRISPVTKMPEFYHGIDIFATPSHRESFGVAALEASSCGLPVVATKVGGLRETVVDQVTGILVPQEDVEALRKAIEQLAKSESLRKRMGEFGRQKVQKEYEWKNNVEQMKHVYESLTK